jgi:hypothetical protein
MNAGVRMTNSAVARAAVSVSAKKLFGDVEPPTIKFVLPVWQQDSGARLAVE